MLKLAASLTLRPKEFGLSRLAQATRCTEKPALWAALFFVGFAAVASRLGTDASFDFMNYHFYNGFAVYHDRSALDIVPAQLQTALYSGLDAVYYPLFVALNGHPTLLNVLMSIPYAAAATLLFLIARIFVGDASVWCNFVSPIAAVVGLTGAAVFPTLATTMSDLVPGLPLLAGLTFWLYLEKAERNSVRTALVTGALAGLSVGFKLTQAPLFLGMFLALGIRFGFGTRSSAWEAVAFGFAGVVVFAVADAGWLVHNFKTYGNPTFPFWNNIFRSNLVAATPWSNPRFMPRTAAEVLFYPAYWAFRPSHKVAELDMRDPRILFGWLSATLIIAASCVHRFRGRAEPMLRDCTLGLFLAVTFLSSYVLWEKVWSIYRYLAIQESLAGVLVLVALMTIQGGRLRPVFCGLFALVAAWTMWTTRYPSWGRAPHGPLAVSVKLPPIENDAMVLFLDRNPYSYLVPFMPPTARAIGVNNNVVRPGNPGRLQSIIETVVREDRGPVWGVETPSAWPGVADFSLSSYALARSECMSLDTNLAEGVRICKMKRMNRPADAGASQQ